MVVGSIIVHIDIPPGSIGYRRQDMTFSFDRTPMVHQGPSVIRRPCHNVNLEVNGELKRDTGYRQTMSSTGHLKACHRLRETSFFFLTMPSPIVSSYYPQDNNLGTCLTGPVIRFVCEY